MRTLSRLRVARAVLVSTLLLIASGACGGDDPAGPNANVAPLVGSWAATQMTVTADADASKSIDLIEAGASFTINVQPSGQYTATITLFGFPSTEIGTLRIDGDEIVFTRQFPNTDVSRAAFTLSGDVITLRGATEFAFGVDAPNEAATLDSRLQRQ